MFENIMELAKENGYNGDSNTEALAWVNAVAKGLDMSEEARYNRAKKMGFKTDNIYYHGTKNQFDRFDKSTIGANFTYSEDSGFFFTKKKGCAESYSMNHETLEVGRVISTFLKFENPLVDSTDSDYWNPSDKFDISCASMMHDVRIEKRDSILIKGTRNDDICVVFEPSQILSIHAAFDPETEDYVPFIDYEDTFDDFILENKVHLYKGDKNSDLYLSLDKYMNDCFKAAFQENKNTKKEDITAEFDKVINFYDLEDEPILMEAINECINVNYKKEKENRFLKDEKIKNNIFSLQENKQKVNEVLENVLARNLTNKEEKNTKKIKTKFKL